MSAILTAVPSAAEGPDAEAVYAKIMAAVTVAAPSKVGDFGARCKAYGSAPTAHSKTGAADFYMWLVSNMGSKFVQAELVDLVRLMPEEVKRRDLLETAGLIKPQASASLFGMIGGMFAAAPATEYGNAVKKQAEDAQAARSAEQIEEARKAAEEKQKQDEEAAAKQAAESDAKKEAAFKEKWEPKYLDQDQKTMSEIRESRTLNDLWKDHPDEEAALTRCTQYVQGLCQAGEQCVKGWHVKCVDEKGLQSECVAVLSSMSFFR